jgi:hypothetical protein
MVDHTAVVNNNGTGILTDGIPSAVLMNNTVLSGNLTGINFINGASLSSYKNNAINLNFGSDGAPSGTVACEMPIVRHAGRANLVPRPLLYSSLTILSQRPSNTWNLMGDPCSRI